VRGVRKCEPAGGKLLLIGKVKGKFNGIRYENEKIEIKIQTKTNINNF
jgi:hypothetical protein